VAPGLAGVAGFGGDGPLGAWLADAVAGVGFYRFGDGEGLGALAFHGDGERGGLKGFLRVWNTLASGASAEFRKERRTASEKQERRLTAAMEERDFFDERAEQRNHTLTCPHCGKADEYQIGWLVRRKKNTLPRHADERDRARFAKAQSYMVRRDDTVGCKNIRCRKRFEVNGLQSVAFI
jgi:hypothetical protein